MRRTLTGAAVLLAAAVGVARAQHPLATLPMHDPAYVQLAALARQGCRAAHVSTYRPYQVRRIRDALRSAAGEEYCTGQILEALQIRFSAGMSMDSADSTGHVTGDSVGFNMGADVTVMATALQNGVFVPLWRDIRPVSEGEESAVGIVRGRVSWSGGRRVVAVTEAFAQTGTRNDPKMRARRFRTSSGVLDFSEAYLAAEVGPLVISAGRSAEAWLGDGEGDESLALSAHGPPLDRINISARWSRWEARALFGTVDDVLLDPVLDSLAPGIPPQRVHRFLAAHAVTFRPSAVVELSLGETALLTRRGSGFDLAFANPLMPFVVTEHDSTRSGAGADENNLTAFGAVRISTGRANVRGELLVDDIQIDAADRKQLPDQLAWRVSGSYALPLTRPASVVLEFSRADSYTYLRQYYSLVYQQYDQPLGSRIGPDAYLFRSSGEVWPMGLLRIAGGLGLWRRGALRINQRPGQSALGHANEPYPSLSASRPEVQRALLANGSVEWLHGILPIAVHAELARVENANNVAETNRTFLRAQIAGSYRFRYP
ncbi:MAG: capsule assembly Wzi family protein [Gemmatimonadaceae bacterium]